MQVAVIGGGVNGVCTAYFLARAGHEVVVLEKFGNVAQESTSANAGLVAPGGLTPWALPGMPRRLIRQMLRAQGPVLLNRWFDPALWRWLGKWRAECEVSRFVTNRERFFRLGSYSQGLLAQLREQHGLEYENTSGALQLYRHARDLALAQPSLDLLRQSDTRHALLDNDAARAVEPSLGAQTALTAALHLPDDEAGNCALFTRQMKQVCVGAGVQFHFNSEVQRIEAIGGGIGFYIGGKRFEADAAVLSAGGNSVALLRQVGLRLPVFPVKSYSATVHIRNFDRAPVATVFDQSARIAITRLGTRIRLSGVAEFGARHESHNEKALRLLVKAGEDWFPGAANYNNATFWSGTRPVLPDGVPLLGATPVRHLYLNLGDGACDWTAAAGAGKLIADLVSRQAPDIDTAGLDMARYG